MLNLTGVNMVFWTVETKYLVTYHIVFCFTNTMLLIPEIVFGTVVYFIFIYDDQLLFM